MRRPLQDLFFGLVLLLFALKLAVAYMLCAAVAGCFRDKH